MFSFLNGKSPFDEAEEKLEAGETINGRPKLPQAPIMGWQDGVFLLVLIGLIVGGYYYYQYAKQKSADTFAKCDALFVAAETDASKYVEAEACYNETWDLGFVSDSMEILRQNRLGAIEDLRNQQKDLYADAMGAMAARDTVAAYKVVSEYKGPMLLSQGDRKDWNNIANSDAVKASVAAAAARADSIAKEKAIADSLAQVAAELRAKAVADSIEKANKKLARKGKRKKAQ